MIRTSLSRFSAATQRLVLLEAASGHLFAAPQPSTGAAVGTEGRWNLQPGASTLTVDASVVAVLPPSVEPEARTHTASHSFAHIHDFHRATRMSAASPAAHLTRILFLPSAVPVGPAAPSVSRADLGALVTAARLALHALAIHHVLRVVGAAPEDEGERSLIVYVVPAEPGSSRAEFPAKRAAASLATMLSSEVGRKVTVWHPPSGLYAFRRVGTPVELRAIENDDGGHRTIIARSPAADPGCIRGSTAAEAASGSGQWAACLTALQGKQQQASLEEITAAAVMLSRTHVSDVWGEQRAPATWAAALAAALRVNVSPAVHRKVLSRLAPIKRYYATDAAAAAPLLATGDDTTSAAAPSASGAGDSAAFAVALKSIKHELAVKDLTAAANSCTVCSALGASMQSCTRVSQSVRARAFAEALIAHIGTVHAGGDEGAALIAADVGDVLHAACAELPPSEIATSDACAALRDGLVPSEGLTAALSRPPFLEAVLAAERRARLLAASVTTSAAAAVSDAPFAALQVHREVMGEEASSEAHAAAIRAEAARNGWASALRQATRAIRAKSVAFDTTVANAIAAVVPASSAVGTAVQRHTTAARRPSADDAGAGTSTRNAVLALPLTALNDWLQSE
jgi:hypothetical protein